MTCSEVMDLYSVLFKYSLALLKVSFGPLFGLVRSTSLNVLLLDLALATTLSSARVYCAFSHKRTLYLN